MKRLLDRLGAPRPAAAIAAAAAGLLATFALGGRIGAGKPPAGLKENLDLPFSLSADGEEDEPAPELVVFYGQIYEADSFFYCLDRSLSMAEGEWQTLQREVTRNVRQFSKEVLFGIAFFARETTAFPADRKPAKASEAQKAAAVALVESLGPETWTCLLDGLRAALEMANRSTAPRRAVILLSDGKPACPGADFVSYREKIFQESIALNPRGIPIHTIGIGSDVDDSFLRQLAEMHRGTYRRIAR